jgi:hypothetical protein
MTTTTIPYLRRIAGALALDAETFEELEADAGATPAALATVVLAAVATGVGMSAAGGAGGVASLTAIALLGWALWALLVFELGARLFPSALTRSDVGQLLRTIGFAAAPGMFNVLGVVPGVAAPMFAVTQVWTLLAIVVAVRQALDYTSTTRAVAVCAGAWALSTVMVLVTGFFLGPLVR